MKSAAMPLRRNILLHPCEKLSLEEVQAICGWMATTLAASGTEISSERKRRSAPGELPATTLPMG